MIAAILSLLASLAGLLSKAASIFSTKQTMDAGKAEQAAIDLTAEKTDATIAARIDDNIGALSDDAVARELRDKFGDSAGP